ncbi:MAG: hypothetical protein GWN00_32480 [Aliifodinibius sp.]|nr:hypothetical protein [Fodinibius sp.]NIV15491.1 hypothetical protein [Fodinibius sp.]NIY29334.1 hypothetical protein [Fodinibius sp.]
MNNRIYKSRLFFLATFLIITLVGSNSYSGNYPPRFQAGINFLLAFPQDEFNETVDNVGFGIAGEFLYSLPLVPISLGFSGGYIIYGSETRQERFNPVNVDVETSNNIATGHFLFRAQPRQGTIRPYMDGLIGFNYLFTQTIIKNRSGGEEIASSINFDDFAFSYGGGGGIMITVYQTPIDEGEYDVGLARVNVDLRLRYLFGSVAEYLHEDSIEIAGGDVFYNVSKSVTDIITFQIGVTLEF